MVNAYFGSGISDKKIPYRFEVVSARRVQPEYKEDFSRRSIKVIDGIEWSFKFEGSRSWKKQYYALACDVLTSAIHARVNPVKLDDRQFSLTYDTREKVIGLYNPTRGLGLGNIEESIGADPNHAVRVHNNPYFKAERKRRFGHVCS